MRATASVMARRAALHLLSVMPAAWILPPTPAHAALDQPIGRAVRTRSGVQLIDYREGDGPTPRFGQLVQFHYVGYVPGERPGELVSFDSTFSRNTPYLVKHGNGQTCQGLEEALHTMRVGGRRRVVVPRELGYTGDKGPVPPRDQGRTTLYDGVNAGKPIIFDLELVSASDDPLDRGDYDELDMNEAGQVLAKLMQTPGVE